MKKFAALVLTLCLMTFLIAGCTADSAESGGKTPSDSSEKAPPNTITVADFVGKTEEEILADSKLNKEYNIDFTYDYSTEYDKGVICAQLPVAGEIFTQKPSLTLTVSKGAKIVTVPVLKDLEYTEARQRAESAGLIVEITLENHSKVPKDIVYASSLSPGEKVPEGTQIEIYASLGPEEKYDTVMPEIVGLSFEDARLALEKADLLLNSVTEEYSDEQPAGYVISASASSGTLLNLYEPIDLVISLGQ